MVDRKDIRIREATPADKEAVLLIRDDVYAGRDYLPAFYDSFMASAYTTSFVVLYQNSIVSFRSATLVDGGETVVTRAGRVCKQYEGAGFSRLSRDHIDIWARKNQIKRKVQVVSEEHLADVIKPSFSSIFKHDFTKEVLQYLLAFDNLQLLQPDIELAQGLSAVPDCLLAHYFRSGNISHYLFPKGKIVVNNVPLRVMETNIPLLREQGEATVVFTDLQSNSGFPKGMLSVGTLFSVRRPDYAYNMELYGSDYSTIRSHIIRHLVRCLENCAGIASLFVFVDEDFPFDKVDKVFLDYGIKRTPIRDFTKRLAFEKSLIPNSRY